MVRKNIDRCCFRRNLTRFFIKGYNNGVHKTRDKSNKGITHNSPTPTSVAITTLVATAHWVTQNMVTLNIPGLAFAVVSVSNSRQRVEKLEVRIAATEANNVLGVLPPLTTRGVARHVVNCGGTSHG